MTDSPEIRLNPAVIPLSIYLHWPWCVRKCPYCDFNSHGAPKGPGALEALEGVYVDALLKDLEAWLPDVGEREIQSIFIGGGTPSLMSGSAMKRLLDGVRARFALASDVEITMEANPGTLEAEKFEAFRAAGVNRLSIGIQSFSDDRLKRLGRIHSVSEARETIRCARDIFENFNLDLMYALPGETMAGLREELDEAAESGAAHLSCYQLTIEPGTAFAKHLPEELPDADQTAEMGDFVESFLAEKGFGRYEVSGYAKPGRRCRHNLNYWTFGDYIAAGAGAHGKVSTREGIRREMRFMNPRQYLEALREGRCAAADIHRVSSEDLPFEFMLNALRLLEGVPECTFSERTGLPLDAIAPTLQDLSARGLIAGEPGRIRATRLGLDFLSDVQEAFL